VGRAVVPVVEWVEDEFLQRASHALIAAEGTWLVDPVDNPRVAELDHVVGVIQLLSRHNRDCAAIADRLGVPHHLVPRAPLGPFVFLRIGRNESALWWPDERVLVCGDALGTARYFLTPGERLAVHPLRRLRPPRVDVEPDVVLCGHGPGVFDDADGALRQALRTSRRRIPQQFLAAVRAWRNRAASR
jgi:hypothetical protein